MKYGHTLQAASEEFAQLCLPWLKYKQAKKALAKAVRNLPTNPVDTSFASEFFEILNANLEEIDAAFRQHAAQILDHSKLPKALTMLRAKQDLEPQIIGRKKPRNTTVAVACSFVSRVKEAHMLFACHGIGTQAATTLAESAVQIAMWAEMNTIGLRKITKKFEKACAGHGLSPTADFKQDQYRKRAFLQGSVAIELKSCSQLASSIVRSPRISPSNAPCVEENSEELQLSCPLCLAVLYHPLGLPCGHALCQGCHNSFKRTLGSNTAGADKKGTSCHVCRIPYTSVPVRMPYLEQLVQTVRSHEWVTRDKEEKLDEENRRREKEKQLQALNPNARMMCSLMDQLNGDDE